MTDDQREVWMAAHDLVASGEAHQVVILIRGYEYHEMWPQREKASMGIGDVFMFSVDVISPTPRGREAVSSQFPGCTILETEHAARWLNDSE